MNSFKRFNLKGSIVIFAWLNILIFSSFSNAQQNMPQQEPLPLEEIRALSEVFGWIKKNYVDSVDDKEILNNAIKGMVATLDPHSSFLQKQKANDIISLSQGYFGGLGLQFDITEGVLKVLTPLDNTPASAAGILPGDIIVAINDEPVSDQTLEESIGKMRGKIGTDITLSIGREGFAEPINISLTRSNIHIEGVSSEILEEYFIYLRLSVFQNSSAPIVRTEIEQLTKKMDGNVRGLILDLRNNPGGTLDAAIDITDLFLEEGEIVSIKGKSKTQNISYVAKPDDILEGAPILVLVNAGSASASEITAGAIQDHKRGIVMGSKTFGKGSVQTLFPLSNGDKLKLTTARYYTPNGRSIQATGIVPDIVSFNGQMTTPTENHRTREKDLSKHLSNDDDEQDNLSNISTEESLIEEDSLIREALNLLKGMWLIKSSFE